MNPTPKAAPGVSVEEELQLIEAVLRGYPESMARADALRAVKKLLAQPPSPVGTPQEVADAGFMARHGDRGASDISTSGGDPMPCDCPVCSTVATPAGAVPPEPILSEAAKWLHAAYDRPPQSPEVKAMLARVDAAALPLSGGVQVDAAREAWRFNGDRASASAITTWANSFPELDEGEPNASYITTDGSDVVTDLLLAVDDEDMPVQVGDYVAREDGKFCILRAALASQPPAVAAIPEGMPSDVSFQIVSAWLQQEGKMANGDQLYTMCRFADFVLSRAPATAGEATAAQGAAAEWIDPEVEPPPRNAVVLFACKPGCFADYMPQIQTGSSEWLHFGGKGKYTHWARINLPGAPSPAAPGNGEGGK